MVCFYGVTFLRHFEVREIINVIFNTVFSEMMGIHTPSGMTHSKTHEVSITRETGGKKMPRHSSLPWDMMFKWACVSVTDKALSGPLWQITASSLAEQTALTWRTDPRHEALCPGWSLASPACPGSSDCPSCQSWGAATKGETLSYRCCRDRLGLLWQWRTKVGYCWLET